MFVFAIYMNNKHFQMQHCHNISTVFTCQIGRTIKVAHQTLNLPIIVWFFLDFDGIRLQNQQIYKNRTKTIIDNEQSIFILRYYAQN